MRASALLPGKYLKAADLQGREILITMNYVQMETMNDGKDKPVLYFVGAERGMVLNKTNVNNIAYLYGDETDEWHGKQIVLFEAIVDMQGKSTPAIRVKAPQRSVPRPDPITSGPPKGHQLNDEIPF